MHEYFTILIFLPLLLLSQFYFWTVAQCLESTWVSTLITYAVKIFVFLKASVYGPIPRSRALSPWSPAPETWRLWWCKCHKQVFGFLQAYATMRIRNTTHSYSTMHLLLLKQKLVLSSSYFYYSLVTTQFLSNSQNLQNRAKSTVSIKSSKGAQ